MKKIFFAAAIMLSCFSVWANGSPTIDQKVLTAFKSTFGEVSNVTWSEQGQFVEAHFVQNGIRNMIRYDLDGNVIKSLRYYGEKSLPVLVLSNIRNNYSNKQVFGVTEESSSEGVIYHIILQDDGSWYKVNATSSGNLQLVEKLKKA